MEVDTNVFYWTPAGMQESTPLHVFTTTAYVEKREAERLLEQAHARGYARGEAETIARAAV